MISRRAVLPAAVLATALLLTACGSADGEEAARPAAGDGQTLQVATGFYPLEFLAERIGGPAADVENLSPAGGEPHDLELTPQQVARLSQVDLVVYLAGFQPAVDEAVEQQAADRSLDVTDVVPLEPGGEQENTEEEHGEEQGEEHANEGADPHVWLDPARYAEIATAVAERLGELDPDRAAAFTAAGDALRADLDELDEAFRTGLADCERRQIVTSHDAFGYLARAYDLEQVPVTGLTPEDEPSPRRLAEVARLAEASGVTTIFFEDTASPKVAEALASEVGAEAAVLSPLENAPDEGDYLTAMRENLATLQTALGCSTP